MKTSKIWTDSDGFLHVWATDGRCFVRTDNNYCFEDSDNGSKSTRIERAAFEEQLVKAQL